MHRSQTICSPTLFYQYIPAQETEAYHLRWLSFLTCLSFSFSLSLSCLGLVHAGSVWPCQKLNAQSKASPVTPGAHSRDLPYLAHLCSSGFGLAPDWLGSVDYGRGARVPIPGTTSQAGCPSLKWISPTLLCIPWGRHMAFCRVGGPRTRGWGNSCDKYNQLVYLLHFPSLTLTLSWRWNTFKWTLKPRMCAKRYQQKCSAIEKNRNSLNIHIEE